VNRHNEEEVREKRQAVVRCARDMLSGLVDVIEGSRALSSLSDLGDGDFDPDFIPFIAIDSETDHLPVGNVRKYWDLDVLAHKDLEIREAEEFHREAALAACRRLVNRFGHDE
jgi:hypothetical protein